jgi:hypothetical protein
MTMPQRVRPLLDQMLESMVADPQHMLDWRLRRELYREFGSFSEPIVYQARGWLAVLAAQRVLPIFQTVCPAEKLPEETLEAAINVLRGAVELEATWWLAEQMYHRCGHDSWWCTEEEDEDDYVEDEADDWEPFPAHASTAAFASYKAILEVRGWEDPFEYATSFHKNSQGFAGFGQPQEVDDVPGTECNDLDWSRVAAVGDTASAAAIAYALDAQERGASISRLAEFWGCGFRKPFLRRGAWHVQRLMIEAYSTVKQM